MVASGKVQRANESSVFLVLVVDGPRAISLGHTNATEVNRTGDWHGWEDRQGSVFPVRLTNIDDESANGFSKC
jgi:hypothetical protein